MMKNNIANNRLGKRTACAALPGNITGKGISANENYFFLIALDMARSEDEDEERKRDGF
jgi:hypothetical protein